VSTQGHSISSVLVGGKLMRIGAALYGLRGGSTHSILTNDLEGTVPLVSILWLDAVDVDPGLRMLVRGKHVWSSSQESNI